MAEIISFKAYLKRDGQDVEVRRFGIDNGAATNFVYLRKKIQAMFPSIQNNQFSVFWQDNDKDYVAIGSDEELIEALTSLTTYPFKLFINFESQQQQNDQGASGQPQAHPGIVCDSCDKQVVGFRYKCVTCSDFDLCAACEGASKHPEHFMLRLPVPFGSASCHPKYFRKIFGRPHKFHKFAKHYPQAAGFASASARGCPFSRRDGSAPAPAGGDMFDFSSLLEFINSMTNPNAQGSQSCPASEPTTNAQASTNSQSAPRPSGVEYLNGIGQAISAFLDPFDLPEFKKRKILKKVTKKACKKGGLKGLHLDHKHFGHGIHKLGPRIFSHGHRHGLHGHGHGPHGPGNGPHGHGHGPHGHGHGPHGHGHGPHGHGHGPRGHGLGPHRPQGHGPYRLGHGPHGIGHGPQGHKNNYGFQGVNQQNPDIPSGFGFISGEAIIFTEGNRDGATRNSVGVDVSFDVRTPSSRTEETPAPHQSSSTTEPPAPASAPSNASAPTTTQLNASSNESAPTTTQLNAPSNASAPNSTQINAPSNTSTPTSAQLNAPSAEQIATLLMTSPQNLYPAVPVLEKQSTTAKDITPPTARRNSDDWTLINRESPTRAETAMDVDEGRAVAASAEAPKATPSAPTADQAETLQSDERQRIQEAITNIRSMGFNYETTLLRELLRRENGDIASVLETILNNTGKK